MLQLHLKQIDAIDAAMVSVDEEVEATLYLTALSRPELVVHLLRAT